MSYATVAGSGITDGEGDLAGKGFGFVEHR